MQRFGRWIQGVTRRVASAERATTVSALVSLGALTFALGHLVFPDARIDSITVTLMVIAILPWLGSVLASLELPGGMKIQYRELQQLRSAAKDAGLLAEPTTLNAEPAYLAVAEQDPNLALTGLRIEIEKRLRALAEKRGVTLHRASARRLVEELRALGALTPEESAVLADLIGLGNQAAHGAEVASSGVDWATEISPRLLASLDRRIAESFDAP